MAGEPEDGWETVTDPTEIQKVLGKNGANKVLGLTAGGPASGGGKAASEGERKAAFLATRLAGSVQQINAAGKDAQTPGFASLFGGTSNVVGNFLTGSDRQRVENAQLDLLDSALTLGTGAAYTKEQLQGYRQSYFPQLGDSEETVADKKKRLDLALQAARIGAGSAASQIDEALKAAGFTVPQAQAKGGDQQSGAAGAIAGGGGTPPAGPGGSPPPQNRDAGGTLQFADEGPQMQANAMRLTDEQFAQFQQAAQSGASAERLAGIATAFGRAPDAEGLKNLEGIAAFYAKPENRKIPLGVDYQRDELKAVDPGDGAAGAAARGAGNALTLGFLDEAGALADTVTQGGTYGQNLDHRRGQELYDEQNNGLARFAGQVVGGLPLGALDIVNAGQAARTAGIAAVRGGVPATEARALSNRIFASRTALEAAGLGGAYGFGEGEDGLGSRIAGAGIGAAVSGALGGAVALGGGRFARAMAARQGGGPRPPTGGQEVLAAAERQNIIPFPADVGGAATRRATSAAAQTIAGASPIVQGARAAIDSAQAVRDRVAAGLGRVVGVEETGEVARRGADAYRARTSAQVTRIYNAAEAAGGEVRVTTPEALRVMAQELPSLEESPVQGAGVAILQELRDQLQGGVSVRGLRNARSTLREEFENNGLRRSNTERIADRVLTAATDDIVNGLRAQGQERAANLYQRADRLWRERLANIDENLEPILGDATGPRAKSGEQIVASLKQAMAGNNRRFVGFLSTLPPEERGIVRASMVSRLGQATKGQQDETGEAFSLNTFLTNWNDIGNRAKTALFGDDGRAALNDLARYAAGSREAQRFANFSNTGGAVGNLATGATVAAGLPTLAATLVAQYGAGRLLSSPAFARWLARPPRNLTPAATQAYVQRLARIARSEPAIAQDVLALQRRLTDAFGGAPARLAADERRDRAGVADGQNRNQQRPTKGLQP